ncbi:MAG: PilZ domain-containing protein [Oscillospiraceae bacterium]|nr:PilZ domain-containing protein [Oscillospiraceae bacterium]
MQKVKVAITDSKDKLLAKAVLVRQDSRNAVLELSHGFSAENFTMGETVNISMFDTLNGLIVCTGELMKLSDGCLHIRNLTIEQNISKRIDIKVPLGYDAYILRAKNTDDVRTYHKFYVYLNDLSAGGIGFTSKEDLPDDEIYEFVFDHARESVVIQFKILHKTKKDDGSYFYGCCFHDPLPYHEKIIREYVFQRQISSYDHNK